nr:hypothetical protein [Tanacetum cinerariifolium]
MEYPRGLQTFRKVSHHETKDPEMVQYPNSSYLTFFLPATRNPKDVWSLDRVLQDVQTKDLHTADYTQLYDFLKYNQKEVDELKAERIAKIQDPLALMANSNNPFASPAPHQDLSPLNHNFLQQPITNPEDITDPITAMNMALALMAKAFKLNYSTPTNNNQRISSNPRNRQIAQPGMNMDRQIPMIEGNGGNQFRQYAGQIAGNLNGYNEVQNVGNQVAQNPRVQNVGTQIGLLGVQGNGIQNQIGNGNRVAARAEGNAAGQNANQIRVQVLDFDVLTEEMDQALADRLRMEHTSVNGQEADSSLAKHKLLELDFKRLLKAVGKCKDTSCVSDTQNQVFQKLENANVELEFQVFNYAKENAHFKATYKNLFDSISVTHAAKFVGDFKSLVKEADASLAKHKILELEIERLLKAVVSQDIISVVQNAYVVNTSDLQTELERTKEHFENCIIKKETEYAKLWNDWYKKCNECKYDKILYDKAYTDMQQKIERLQAQLGDLKGKKNAHLKATYKNLFDSISVSRVQTETKIASLQNELQSNIYKNAKLRTQLFKKVSYQKDTNQDSSKNTKFAKQPNVEILSKIGESNALSKPVTSNSVSTPPVSKGVNNAKVIAPGMFRISPDKVSREAKKVPYTIEWLQAQLGDLKGKSKDTSCVSDTQNPLSRKLENENVELEFQVLNYARENAHHKATYKNLFDSISVSLTSNSVSTPQESKGMKNDNVIAPGIFRINPSKTSREEKHVPNTVSASNRTKPITVSQPPVITKKDMNSNLNGLSSIGVDNTNTRRPQPRSNTKHDRVPSTSKSSRSKNKEAEVEEHHRNLLLSKNNKHISPACNNILIDSQDNVSPVQEPQVRQMSTASTTIADNVPTPTNSSSHAKIILIPSQDVDELNPNAMVDGNTFVNPFANPSTSAAAEASSSQNVDPSNMHTFYQPYPHEFQWTKDHPLEQVIGEPSRPVLIRNQL